MSRFWSFWKGLSHITNGGLHVKREDEATLKENLDYMEKKGVSLYLDGKPSSPEEIANRFCVNEDMVYMPDFVMDDDGTLKEVRYDKVMDR